MLSIVLFLVPLGPGLRLRLGSLSHLGLGRRRLAHLGRAHRRRLPVHLRLGLRLPLHLGLSLGLPLHLRLGLGRRPVHLGWRLERRLLLLG